MAFISREEAINQYDDILKKLNINDYEQLGGLIYLDVSKDDIKEIISHSAFNDMDASHNGAPTNQMFIDFINENPEFVGESMLVSPKERTDYRFEIVGIKAPVSKKTETKLYNFVNHLPDDIESPAEYNTHDGYVRAWWD